MTKFKVNASNLANCVRLAGNSSAGILLYRIYVRSIKSGMKCSQGETNWAVLSPEEWTRDTGLTIKQIKYNAKILKDKNLIIWKNEHRGKCSGAPPLWAKISDEIRAIIEGNQFPCGNWVRDTKGTDIRSPKGTPIYNCVNNINNVKELCKPTELDSNKESNVITLGDKGMKKGAGRGRDILRNKKFDSLEDALKSQQGRKRSKKITGVNDFEILWIQLHSEFYDDKIEKWTGKEQGYAKSIITKSNKRKRFDLAKVITAVISNWEEYADYAATQRGQDKGPFHPNIGYIAAGFQDLVYWFKEHTEFMHSSAQKKEEGGALTLEEALERLEDER